MKRFKNDPVLNHFARIFHDNNYSCYLVGGAVRNAAAGLPSGDYDFATDAQPEEIIKIFHRTVPTGIQHGTITVLFRGRTFEVTTFRVDGKYEDSRRPESVSFTPSLEEDLKRRDFTINALALNLSDWALTDLHNGLDDLKNGIIRVIGDPEDRFSEDGLRLMRACRFSAKLDFIIEKNTLEGITAARDKIRAVSPERIQDELVKLLSADSVVKGLEYLERTGLMDIILPDLSACRGILQKGFHDFDVLHHLFFTCEGAPKDSTVLRLAALFHDIGKPSSIEHDELGIPTFHNHEKISADIAKKILQQYRFPKSVEKEVVHLIISHMFNYHSDWSDAAVRRFIARTGADSMDALLTLRKADQYGMVRKWTDSPLLEEFRNRIEALIHEEHAMTIKDLALDGNDLIRELELSQGPAIGIILGNLLETVLDDPSMNTRESLLAVARSFYETYFNR